MKLLLNAVTKYLAGAVLVGLLLFLPMLALEACCTARPRELEGYQAYAQKIPFRLIPYIW